MTAIQDSPAQHTRQNLPGNRACAALLLVLAVFLAFAPMLGKTNFVLDDQVNLVDNPYLRPVTAKNIAHFWTEPHIRLYIPVTYTAWSLLALLAGDPPPDTPAEARLLHLANILLHAANVLLVFALLARCGASTWAAFFGALLFAVHPLQTEAVCWLTELKTLLAAFFSFSAMLAFLHAAGTARKKTAFWLLRYCGSLLLLLLGILAKPLAVCSVPLLFVLAAAFLRTGPLRTLKLLAPHALLCLLVILATMQAQPMPLFFTPPGLADRLPVALDTAGFYLAKLLVPAQLSIDYARTPDVVLQGFPANGYWALPVLAGALLLFYKAKRNRLLACLALLLAGILPVSGLAPFGYQFISTVADRYAYFAMLGPALAVAVLFSPGPNKFQAAAAILAAALLLGLTHRQAGLWKHEHTLGKQAVSAYPAGIYGLSAYVDTLPATPQSLELLRTHLAAYPLDPYNTANYARQLAELDGNRPAREAAPDKDVLAKDVLDLFQQGVRLAQAGNRRDAWTAFVQVVLLDPNDAPSWNNLGSLLAASGYGTSRQCLVRALALAPNDPRILNNAGLQLFHAGQRSQGLQFLEQAARQAPTPEHKSIAANLAKASQAVQHQQQSDPPLLYTPILRHPAAAVTQ